jgi:tRNA(fMet)-specific endonuclease VapC
MNYLLDTSACIDAVKNRAPAVRKRLGDAIRAGSQVYVSSVVSYELWYGVAKSARPEENAELVMAFLGRANGLLSFDQEDAKVAARVRAKLEKDGRTIGSDDLLIAGQALRHKMTLITSNVREFSRVQGLNWEDWAKA